MANGVKFELVGTKTVSQMLKGKGKKVVKLAEEGVKQAGFFMEGEVKESIAGHRAEPKSVDTGRFLSSVATVFPKKLQAQVETNLPYAKNLELGTSKIAARSHFGNSASRNKAKVTQFIQDEVNKI